MATHQPTQQQEQFRSMVAGVKDCAIFLLTTGGIIDSWNAGAERIKGYRADEIIGKHFSIFYPKEAVGRGWPELELKVAAGKAACRDENYCRDRLWQG